jgi:hypothetical protein
MMHIVKLLLLLVVLIIFPGACRTPVVQGISGMEQVAAATGRELWEAADGNRKDMDLNQGTGEILVKFKPGVTRETLDRIAQENGLRIIRLVSPPGLYLLEIRTTVSEKEMIQRISRLVEVEYAEPNYTRR